MKKVLSITLSLLMLTAMLHLSVATHYCGGKLASSKVSLTGILANCGMEGSEEELPFPGNNLKSHCCDDIVTILGINNNYTPSVIYISDVYQTNLQVFFVPDKSSLLSAAILKSIYTNVSPPGVLMSTSVDLSDICIFRI